MDIKKVLDKIEVRFKEKVKGEFENHVDLQNLITGIYTDTVREIICEAVNDFKGARE